jgi:hypothetical protein
MQKTEVPNMVQPSPVAPAPAQQRGNGFAVTSLVLGIIGVAIGWLLWLGLILGPLAIIFGVVGLVKSKTTNAGKGLSIVGIVTGAVAIVIVVLITAFFVASSSELVNDAVNELCSDSAYAEANPELCD